MKTLNETWIDNIKKANERGLTHFIFVFEFNYYYSEWHKLQWTQPSVIVNLSYLNLGD